MSDLTALRDGKLSFPQFFDKELKALYNLIGAKPNPDALNGAADDIETVKAEIERAVNAYLAAKYPAIAPLASTVADSAINALASGIEGAARSLAKS